VSVSPPAVASAQNACSTDSPAIGELAGSAPDLSTLVAAVKAANLTDVLSLPGPINVFAPTNEAFGTLLAQLGVTAEQLLSETALLTNVLQYHVVVDGAVCEGDLSGAVTTALTGASLTVDGSTVTDANGSVANIVGAINAGNGVVYVIDSVLLPPADSPAAAAPAPAA
jgi:transforming growth factor-beta-induced protein